MRRRRRHSYAGVLDIPAGTSGKVEVRHVEKPAGTTLPYGNGRTALFGQKPGKVRFAEPTRWHELSEEKFGVWMTDYPIEQRQTDDLVVSARGRVLVGGLGLGYAVVALAARPKVTAITVVERSADVIALVWEATVQRAQAVAREEGRDPPTLTVVHMDLFDYLAALQPKSFQWALYDIWQSDGETTFHDTVVPLRRLSHGKVNGVVCWNEDIMRGQLMQGLWSRQKFLELPHFEDRGISLSLDQLCEPRDNKWHDWAVPFWRWYRSRTTHEFVTDDDLVNYVMGRFVRLYGLPEAADAIEHLLTIRPAKAVAS